MTNRYTRCQFCRVKFVEGDSVSIVPCKQSNSVRFYYHQICFIHHVCDTCKGHQDEPLTEANCKNCINFHGNKVYSFPYIFSPFSSFLFLK